MNQNYKIIKSNNSWIESIAIDQLRSISQLSGVLEAVGMPDLHAGKTPNGAVYLTQDILYPHIIGNDIGCGIALFDTSLKAHRFNVQKTKKQFDQYDQLSDIELEDSLTDYGYPIQNKLGTIGSGNHFGEFQSIGKIINYNYSLKNNTSLSKISVVIL